MGAPLKRREVCLSSASRPRPVGETLDAVAKGKLNAQHYPAATTATPLQGAKHDQVIVYIVGGVTYEEATKVAELNAANAGVSVVLGGSFVHNSGTFLEDLDDAFGGRR